MIRLMQTQSDVGSATPYDHLDYYNKPLHRYPTRKITFEGREWANRCVYLSDVPNVKVGSTRNATRLLNLTGGLKYGCWPLVQPHEI